MSLNLSIPGVGSLLIRCPYLFGNFLVNVYLKASKSVLYLSLILGVFLNYENFRPDGLRVSFISLAVWEIWYSVNFNFWDSYYLASIFSKSLFLNSILSQIWFLSWFMNIVCLPLIQGDSSKLSRFEEESENPFGMSLKLWKESRLESSSSGVFR